MATGFVVAVYLVSTWLFGGVAGLAVGVAAAVGYVASGRRTGPLWVAAVVCMAAVPVALMAQGLPGDDVVGPSFAENHWLAHLITGAALALAALAVLAETVTPERVMTPAEPDVPAAPPPAPSGSPAGGPEG